MQGRSGEKFIQGLLWYILNNDSKFSNAFCRWARWPPRPTAVIEEVMEGRNRHDLQLRWSNGMRRNIELKLWAGPTDNQIHNPDTIDLLICPKRYDRSFNVRKRMHWEDFAIHVATASDFSKALFVGLDDFAWTGGAVSASSVRREIEEWYRGDSSASYGSWFLRGCGDIAAKLGLVVRLSTRIYKSKRVGFWGHYFQRPLDDKEEALWNGFIFTLDRSGTCDRMEFLTQIGRRREERLHRRWPTVIPDWYPFLDWGRTGILYPSVDGKFTISGWIGKSEPLLKAYSKSV